MASTLNTDDESEQGNQGTTTNLNAPQATPQVGTSAGGSAGSGTTAAPTIGGPQGGGSITPGGGAQGGTGAASGVSATPKGTTSGSFNNLQKYMTANQDFNQAGGGLAGTINSNITNQAQNVQGNLTATQQAFANQNQAAVNPLNDTTTVNSVLAAPSQYVGTTANPLSAQNAQTADTFGNLLNATYTGPTSLSNVSGNNNYNTLSTQTAGVTGEAGQTQSEAGRFNLLQQMFNNPNYTQGEQSLDQTMLQTTPGQLQSLNQGRQAAANLNQNLNAAQNAATQTGAAGVQQANQVSSATQAAINNAIANQNTSMAAVLPAAQAAATAAYNTAGTNLSNNQLSATDMATLRAAGLVGDSTYNWQNVLPAGVTPASLFTSNAGQLTAQNTMSQTDYNNMVALGQLAGTTATPTSSADVATYAGAPTTTPSAYTFSNPQAIVNAIAAQKAAYGSQTGNMQTNINNDLAAINSEQAAVAQGLEGAGGNIIGGPFSGATMADVQGQMASQQAALNALSAQYGINSLFSVTGAPATTNAPATSAYTPIATGTAAPTLSGPQRRGGSPISRT